jgi:hypothetical protein
MPNMEIDDIYSSPMAPLGTTGSVQTAAINNTQGGGYQGYQAPSVSGATTPNVGGAGGVGGKPGFFQEGGAGGFALGAIQTLGSLWNSFQQNKLAKKSLDLQTRAFDTNLANQTKTYNTALEDRINARYATEGRSQEAAGYIEKNRL